MKQVDRPPRNPKRTIIESSQECFSVDTPRLTATGDPPNASRDGDRSRPRKRPAVLQQSTNQLPSGDDNDDFMPPKKKSNAKLSVTKKMKVEDTRRQRLNIRCNPQDVLVCIQIMNERQRQAVVRKGFFNILDMTIDALGSRTHLCWLMEKLDPKDMTLRIGPGKELKITKETVHLILGLPNTGGGKPLNIDEVNAAVNLRSSLGISKDEFGVAKLQERLRLGGDDDLSIRCFFLILFNRLLFPTASWSISNNEVLLTEQLDRFPHIDWCHLIFNDLCEAAHKWHNRSTTNVSATIYGCSIVVLVYYLDHLHHAVAPNNKSDTPRIKYFDKKTIKALSMADKRKPRQGGEPFGHCDFRSSSETCYAPTPEFHGQFEFQFSSDAFDVAQNAPCGHHTISIQVPLIKDMISSKIQQLPAYHHPKFEAKLRAYDSEVGKSFATINQRLSKIVKKQYDLADTFGELIDEVLRAEINSPDNKDDMIEPSNPSASDPLMTATQLESQMIVTQVEAIYKRQQEMCRAFESSRDESVTPQNIRGDTTEDDALQLDSGLVLDQILSGNETYMMHKTRHDSVPLTQMDCVRALRQFLCAKVMDLNRNVIDFGEYVGTCRDIQRSFADGECLDNVFMQCFIDCVRDDATNHIPPLTAHQLILDAIVGAILNFEEQEQHSNTHRPYDPAILENYLSKTLPSFKQLDEYKSIMVPMLRAGHWTLYVINFQNRCIHILDSNPYGPELGETTWESYHYVQMDIGKRKLPWARLIMVRLNMALQHVRPRSNLPRFDNFPIDMAPNCPTMKAGSNDCGFFAMRYIQYYDYMDGAINVVIDSDNSGDLRALALYYLIFHRLNKNRSLSPELERFKFPHY
ncbi:uncharacterized protein [Zea mays]|uniref:uncharacterized protein isoform X4 n=2 Tax=Zea mays TaxID=4577 RepID=UPI0009AA0736|nr:uncharacterized protein LOC100303785 isoform X4 [Zea mays]|eukprot:XP_020407202.1 uncharacterized protein LOC100303785 isoform X4 [Zea mays]